MARADPAPGDREQPDGRRRRLATLLALALAVAGVGLLPWMIYLAISLPPRSTAWHWPAAWVGLDALEAMGLVGTAALLLRRDHRYCLTSMATAGVLLADAWFDMATVAPGSGAVASMLTAALAEVPALVACIGLAVAGLRRLRAEAAGCPADRLGPVRVLVLGSGGREHALARALARDAAVTELHAAPGNPGIGEHRRPARVRPDRPGRRHRAGRRLAADLVVIGPEAPLIAGVADAIREAGFSCFGPDQGAAMIEGSKSFAKQVMIAAGVPTAAAMHMPYERRGCSCA